MTSYENIEKFTARNRLSHITRAAERYHLDLLADGPAIATADSILDETTIYDLVKIANIAEIGLDLKLSRASLEQFTGGLWYEG